MSARRALAAAALVPLALLSACTADEPVPKMPDPTTSEPTSEPTETETPEVETAEEFLRRWQAESDAMQVSGDTEAFLELSADNCRACKDYAAAIEKIYSAGGRVEFAGTAISSIQRRESNPPTFEMALDVPSTKVIRSSTDQETMPGGKPRLLIILKGPRPSWTVTYYGAL